MKSILLILFVSVNLASQSRAPVQHYFMQGNNINTVFSTNGVYNYDKITFTSSQAGFIWPVASTRRLNAIFTSGITIGAKVGVNRELRLAASFYDSHYSPGNIPLIGQIPPVSVCEDTSWKGYYVQLTDQSLINGGIRTKFAGGRSYTFNYNSWSQWPVDKGAPYVEVNGIPGYQPSWDGDRPGIGNGMTARPDELLFMVYMDYTNCTNNIHSGGLSLPGGTLPIGVEIHQISFMFNCVPLQNMYFTKFRFINKSSLTWDSTYIGISNNFEIGEPFDDAVGCDTLRDLGYQYNFDNDDNGEYGINPPATGSRFVQSPVRYTGNNSDTARLPYDTLIGYKLNGMTSFARFLNSDPNPCNNDPDEAQAGYYFLKGLNGCGQPYLNHLGQQTKFQYSGDACNRTGWVESMGGSRRSWMCSGPITMHSTDTQIVVLSYMISRDGSNNFQNVCALQSISDSALYHYYNDFGLCIPIGIQPISTEIPQTFALLQNYPNPFNPSTKIRFNIPSVGQRHAFDTKLKIYDALGREIETLINEELNPGTYEIEWNASNYTSGVYFYSLTAGTFTQTKKMVIIK